MLENIESREKIILSQNIKSREKIILIFFCYFHFVLFIAIFKKKALDVLQYEIRAFFTQKFSFVENYRNNALLE